MTSWVFNNAIEQLMQWFCIRLSTSYADNAMRYLAPSVSLFTVGSTAILNLNGTLDSWEETTTAAMSHARSPPPRISRFRSNSSPLSATARGFLHVFRTSSFRLFRSRGAQLARGKRLCESSAAAASSCPLLHPLLRQLSRPSCSSLSISV